MNLYNKALYSTPLFNLIFYNMYCLNEIFGTETTNGKKK